ncbi:MAG TPA: ATP-binding protein [Candidatus Methylacidiphilales bacterium]
MILLTAVLLLILAAELFEEVNWSDHSYQVLAQASQCQNQVSKLQNQVRGFIITGDPAFIASLDQEDKDLTQSLANLKGFVADNPPQVQKAQEVIDAENAWVQHLRKIVAQQPQAPAVNAEMTVAARGLMDGVVSKFDAFIGVEEGLREDRLKNVRRMKQVLIYAGGGLFALLTLTVGLLVRRHFSDLANDYRSALRTIEQRQADLEEQKEWFRVTLSSIGDGVIVTDEVGRVVFMNGESEQLTGWKIDHAQRKPLKEVFKIVNEETRLTVEDPVDKVFREKKVVGLANHTVLLSADGREFPIEDSAAPIHNAVGKVLGVVLVFHNATDMRRAQHTLKAYSEDLEKKVAERTMHLQQTVTELEAFSYTISHDLRSPLRAMQGFAQAIAEDYGDSLDSHGKNYLDRIRNAAERLDRLIQDLLAYTRISREEAPLVVLDLDKFVRDIIEHYPNLHALGPNIEVVGSLPKVWGREAALTQVLSNLLGNAAKFVPTGRKPQIKIWGEDVDGRIRVWIQDNGIGIAPRDFERIFQMFIQINDPALYGGTGVGLAIVRKAVQTMKGTVGLESEEGKGTKFWVELHKAS